MNKTNHQQSLAAQQRKSTFFPFFLPPFILIGSNTINCNPPLIIGCELAGLPVTSQTSNKKNQIKIYTKCHLPKIKSQRFFLFCIYLYLRQTTSSKVLAALSLPDFQHFHQVHSHFLISNPHGCEIQQNASTVPEKGRRMHAAGQRRKNSHDNSQEILSTYSEMLLSSYNEGEGQTILLKS